MEKSKKKITIIMVSLLLMIGIMCSILIGLNIKSNEKSSLSLNSEISTISDNMIEPLAGYDDVAEGSWTLSTGQIVTYYFRADDGAFWTRDHLEYRVTMDKAVPGLKMEITYQDSKGNPDYSITYALDEKTEYTGEDRSVAWNQVKSIIVKLYTPNEEIKFKLNLRYD